MPGFLRSVAAVLCLLVSAAGVAGAAPDADRHTLFLVTVDTLRADRLAVYGGERELVSALGRWADDGIVFDRAYATSSWTVPSVTSLLTSLYPTSHGARHGFRFDDRIWSQESVPSTAVTLAEVLRGAGYVTYAVVANPHLDRTFGFARGFDRYVLLDRAPAEDVAAQLLEWAPAVSATPKVFVWLHFMDPHLPYAERAAIADEVAPAVPAEARAAARSYLERLRANAGVAPAPEALAARMDEHRDGVLALYDAEIAAVGRAIDGLLSRIPRLGTGIVAFTADHGEEFLERGFLGHGHNLHDETTRVPLVLRLPRMPVAQRVPIPVSQVDLAPTLLALLGVRRPPGWSGRPLLSADGAWLGIEPSPVLAELDRFELQPVQHSLVQGPWRMLRSEPPADGGPVTRRLYHLPDDPGERRDLAAAHPAEVRGLELLLAAVRGALPRHAAERREVVVSPHTLEALRALGYIR